MVIDSSPNADYLLRSFKKDFNKFCNWMRRYYQSIILTRNCEFFLPIESTNKRTWMTRIFKRLLNKST